ncbi:MAG: TIGR03546 family protein [Planctomycetaceae bacterium]|nr:TIGR03546 family protein [Planctomycetaceae bacterium]
MIFRYFKPIRDLLRIFSHENSPRQLALAIALGLIIGLLPKGNLIAVSLTILMFTLRVNLGAGLTTTFLVSLFASGLDPLTHAIGLRVLGHPSSYAHLSAWHQLPVVPWTSLNNTVVIGGLLLGIALFYPVYHLAEMLFGHLAKRRAAVHQTVETAQE